MTSKFAEIKATDWEYPTYSDVNMPMTPDDTPENWYDNGTSPFFNRIYIYIYIFIHGCSSFSIVMLVFQVVDHLLFYKPNSRAFNTHEIRIP